MSLSAALYFQILCCEGKGNYFNGINVKSQQLHKTLYLSTDETITIEIFVFGDCKSAGQ